MKGDNDIYDSEWKDDYRYSMCTRDSCLFFELRMLTVKNCVFCDLRISHSFVEMVGIVSITTERSLLLLKTLTERQISYIRRRRQRYHHDRAAFHTVFAATCHRRIWRYSDERPLLSKLFGEDANPMIFKEVFKIDFEVFTAFVNWLVATSVKDRDGNDVQRDQSTPFFKWLNGRRKSSMGPDMAAACGVLYLFGRGTCVEKAAVMKVHRSSFERIASFVVDELMRRTSEVIFIPPAEEQVFPKCHETGQPFEGALFAIDGTLCKCTVKGKRNDYYTRKGMAQINVQVMCNWNLDLVHVDSNYIGRTHDYDMYLSSRLRRCVDSGTLLRPGGFIIGDEGYACSGRIIRPYDKRKTSSKKQLFNLFFKSTRRIVENAIGAWKQMCPLLNIGMHRMSPEKLAQTILASAVLYQFCKKTKEMMRRTRENLPPHPYLQQQFTIPSVFRGKDAKALRRIITERLARTYVDTRSVIRQVVNDKM